MEILGAYGWDMPMVDTYDAMFSSSVQVRQDVFDKSNNATEPFPEFVETLSGWKDGDEDVLEAYMNHCVAHCKDRVCHYAKHTKPNEWQEWKCLGCKNLDSKSTSLDHISKQRISQINRNDIGKAAVHYKTLKNDQLIQVNLQTAKALVSQLGLQQVMYFRTYLLESPRFTPSTVFYSDEYNAAAMDANNLTRGFRKYFIHFLSRLPGQNRKVEREDLETEMWNSLQMDIIEWMCKWCFSQSRKKGQRPCRGVFVAVVEGLAKGKWGAGIMAVFERMDELVRLVVGMLSWWDLEGRNHG